MALEMQKNFNGAQWGEIKKMPESEFNDRTVIKLREGIKSVLDNLKQHRRETYDDVITKLITEHGLTKHDIPISILKNLDERIEDIHQGRVYSVEDAKKMVFDDGDKV